MGAFSRAGAFLSEIILGMGRIQGGLNQRRGFNGIITVLSMGPYTGIPIFTKVEEVSRFRACIHRSEVTQL